jgi:segregation and condensation protein B
MSESEKEPTQNRVSHGGLQELERIIEAALFATDETLSIRQLQALFPTEAVPTADELKSTLDSLAAFYQDRGIELRKLGKGWRFHTRDIYSDWIAKMFREKPPRYSRALMETLSIIAYRQPVTRGEIEEIRGVAVSSDMVRTLTERGWVVAVGHRDVPGRPELLGTTDVFLQYFNLASLKELPELPDRRDLQDVAKDSNVEMPVLVVPESDETESETAVKVTRVLTEAESKYGDHTATEADSTQLAEVIELPLSISTDSGDLDNQDD